jgi:hypothetical protein
MDEIDDMEAEMHQVLDQLNCDPELIELMRELWVQHLDLQRQECPPH